jgi:hypothetical protein
LKLFIWKIEDLLEPTHDSYKSLLACSMGFHDACGGFSDTAEGWIASHPLEGSLLGTEALSQLQSWLEAFRGKDCFRIGTGNFADRDPAESAD